MSAIGDNIGNVPPAEVALETISAKLVEFEQRRQDILDKLAKVSVTDEDTTGRAAAMVKAIRALDEAVCQRGKEVAGPYGEAYDAVSARVANWLAGLRAGLDEVNAKIEAFRQSERQKIAEQKAEQAQAEAAARAAANPKAPTPEPAPQAPVALPAVRGDYGTLTSDRKIADYKIVDPRQLPDQVLNAPAVRKAMVAACKQLGRLTPDIPGAERVDSVKSSTRS